MDKQRKTFLSYSRLNKDFAIRLAKELKAEGFDIWLDQLDIPAGSRWDREVETALKESEIFMIILTSSSVGSENVLDEIGYAIDNHKRFLPVLLEKCEVPLRLRRFQYVDFTDKSFDDGVQSAKELLRSLIAQPTIPRVNPPGQAQDRPAIQQPEGPLFPKTDAEAGTPAAQTPEKPKDGPDTATGVLRREKLEQELQFRAEEARLKKEKADVEKLLEEERSTRDRMPAVPTKPRSRGFGMFGIAVIVFLVIAASGYALTRFMRASNAPEPTPTKAIASATERIPAAEAQPSETSTSQPTSTMTEVPTDTPEPTADVTATPAFLITDDKEVEMVLVPEGEFSMGSSRGEPDEQPVHLVALDAFYIDKFEVTNKSYAACVESGSCEPPRKLFFFPESPNRAYFGNSQYDNYPVIYVDWNQAKAYCEWRGARLPTEAEWEKTARGTDERTYAWGKDLVCQKANYQGCVNLTSEVGAFPDGASPYGALDMTGNVWEWVSDWYASNYYSVSTRNNPAGPIMGQSRQVRGGSWTRFDVTAYHRANLAPTYNNFDIGIRCARDQ